MRRIKYISIDSEDILDYINGECNQNEMFRRKKYRIKTTNAYNKEIYKKEYEDYMKEWTDYDYSET